MDVVEHATTTMVWHNGCDVTDVTLAVMTSQESGCHHRYNMYLAPIPTHFHAPRSLLHFHAYTCDHTPCHGDLVTRLGNVASKTYAEVQGLYNTSFTVS